MIVFVTNVCWHSSGRPARDLGSWHRFFSPLLTVQNSIQLPGLVEATDCIALLNTYE
jgi:hypothetical protein